MIENTLYPIKTKKAIKKVLIFIFFVGIVYIWTCEASYNTTLNYRR